jgi:hypothetical protein
VDGYLELPPGWERVGSDGPGPFVTTELLRRPDGTLVRWESRRHRKGSGGFIDQPGQAQPGGARVWWRPLRRNWWMAVLFIVGSGCFMAGGVLAQWSSISPTAIGIVFFVGSLFFTSAAYLQYAEAVNVQRRVDARQASRRWHPASWEPIRIDWLAAVVQLIGTVLFNLSTFGALQPNPNSARVWAPDVFGSIAFLISSELAFAEVCHRWVSLRHRTLAWWIVALNLLGSIAFGVSAVASLFEAASGGDVSARISNAATALGALGFLLASVLLIPEAASEEQASPLASSRPAAPQPAPAGGS